MFIDDTNGSLDIFQSYKYFHAKCSLQCLSPWPNFLFTSATGEEGVGYKCSNKLPPVCLGVGV